MRNRQAVDVELEFLLNFDQSFKLESFQLSFINLHFDLFKRSTKVPGSPNRALFVKSENARLKP
jgi:hypothetical protein